jgi:hypothetical protein
MTQVGIGVFPGSPCARDSGLQCRDFDGVVAANVNLPTGQAGGIPDI